MCWKPCEGVAKHNVELGKHLFSRAALGGAWARANCSVTYDAAQGRCLASESVNFVASVGANITCRFSFGLLGEAACQRMRESWVNTMAYVYSLWESEGSAATYTFNKGS